MKVLAIRSLADRAVTLDLAREAGRNAAGTVHAVSAAIESAVARGQLAGATGVTPSFVSVTVHYDALVTSQEVLVRQLVTLVETADRTALPRGRLWRLPCCYQPPFGTDLDELSRTLSLSAVEIVALHASCRLDVYALGFLPGLPFMGALPETLAVPRRATPRVRLPAGSVATAIGMCVIYPWESPGGWHVLGRCPVPLFQPRADRPALLSPGDSVRFYAVRDSELATLSADLAEGRLHPHSFSESL